jgi:hypothetical protein
MNLWQRIGQAFTPARRRRLAVSETDSTFTAGARSWGRDERERYDYDREQVLEQALEAWRTNPLARRIVELTTQYVVGGGLRVRVDHTYTHDFMDTFWEHRLNQMGMKVYELCDELTRAGELFLAVSTDAAGMSYVRAIPAPDIEEITCADNALAQVLVYPQKALAPGEEPRVWPAYHELEDRQNEDGSFPAGMLHYAINRPVGTVRGESDLAPVLRWLSRYSNWLEDRARLNRYRNSFLYVVKGRWQSEEERYARQAALSAAPPQPGSILVTDESESWEVMSPKLESQDANEDGLALKKMIAAGRGPTYRRFEQRQEYFTWLVTDLAKVVIRRRAMVDGKINASAKLQVTGADLSARDNAALAVAMSTASNALGALRDRAVIDDAEMLRMVYRFAGEVVDVEALLERGKKAGYPVKVKAEIEAMNPPGPTKAKQEPGQGKEKSSGDSPGSGPARTPGKPAGIKVNGETGDLNGMPKEEQG